MDKKIGIVDILLISIPSTMAVIIEPIAAMVDTSFMGRIGTSELAAIGLGVNVLLSISWMFNLLLYQVTAEVARSEATGDKNALKKSLKVALSTSFFVSVLVCTALLLCLDFILIDIMQADANVYDLAKSYIFIRAPFFILFLIGSIFLGALRGKLGHKNVLFIAVVETLVNITATWILVRYYDFSIVGAAIGTVIAKLVSVLLSSHLLFRDLEFGMLEMMKFKIYRKDILNFGLKSSYMFVRSFSLQLLFFLAVTYVSREGSTVLASYQVCLELWLLFSFVVEGIAIICTADGGQLYHAKQRRQWVGFSQAAISTSVIIGLLFALLFLFFPRFFILIFTNQAEVITSCLSVLWLIALFQPLNGVVFTLDGILFGSDNFKQLAVGCLAGLLFSLFFLVANSYANVIDPLTAVWLAMGLMNISRLTTSFLQYSREKVFLT